VIEFRLASMGSDLGGDGGGAGIAETFE
jgi:hypothetical protein